MPPDVAPRPLNTLLYYSPGSCSLAPHIVLNEVGTAHELKKFSTADGGNRSAEYRAINPKALIPALHIDGFLLTENPAILAYLGRRFPHAGLFPVDGGESEARCLEMLAWSSNTIHVAYALIRRPERFLSGQDHLASVVRHGHATFRKCFSEIDAHLAKRRFAAGDTYTVVDPFWLVFYRWGARLEYDMESDYPRFTDYARRLWERSAVQLTFRQEQIVLWPESSQGSIGALL